MVLILLSLYVILHIFQNLSVGADHICQHSNHKGDKAYNKQCARQHQRLGMPAPSSIKIKDQKADSYQEANNPWH